MISSRLCKTSSADIYVHDWGMKSMTFIGVAKYVQIEHEVFQLEARIHKYYNKLDGL